MRLIEKLEFKIALTNKIFEDIRLKYLVFNQTFKIIRNQKHRSCSLTFFFKTILFNLKLLQRKGTLKNFWLINLKFLKTNIIQMKIHLICKTDSRN